MTGPVALVGAGEFLASMADFDLGLLAATGRRRPRVTIVPTAAYPSGEEAFLRVAANGLEHFRRLGADVEAVEVRDRGAADDAASAQAIGEADLVYFCGGRPGYLRRALHGSAVWLAAAEAHARGAILVGSAAGAMLLGERQVDLGIRLGWPLAWPTGLAVAEGIAILPAYDASPEPVMALLAMLAPRGMLVFGIDRETAVVGRDGAWEVHGSGRVTVWRGRRRERHRGGESFRASEATLVEDFEAG